MADANTQVSIKQVRQEIIKFCAEKQFTSAHLHLVQSGIGPETEPGLWEYLARRCHVAGEKAVAHAARRALWEYDVWSGDVALKEAEYFLDKGDYSSSAFILEAVFGAHPDHPEARLLLARSHLMNTRSKRKTSNTLTDRKSALALAKGMPMDNAAHAKTAIDLLRYSDQYEKALEYNDEARAAIPDDVQFVIREARIREKLNDLERAAALWLEVSDTAPQYRIEALFKVLGISLRLDRKEQAINAAAALALEDLPISAKLRLAKIFDQQSVVRALMEFASTGGAAARPIDTEEGTAIAEVLLENGDIGLLAWLRKQRIPIGREAISILDACGFSVNGTQQIPQTFAAAAKVRSPDFMLPLERFLEKEKKPAGWPGTSTIPEKILLVNAGLVQGGAERQFVTLIRALIAAGIRPKSLDVAFFSLAEDRGQRHFLSEIEGIRIKIHDLRERQIHNHALPRTAKILIDALPAPLREDTTALWHIANEIRPNVIHGWQDRSALASGIVGQILSTERVILSFRNMSPATRQDAALIAKRELFREFSRIENFRLTANSVAGAHDYEDWLERPRGSVSLLSNAIDTQRFSPASVGRAKRVKAKAPYRITGTFRMAVNKRPQLWLRTLAELRRKHGLAIEPRICGRGPLLDEVEQLAKHLGLDDLQIQLGTNDPAILYGSTDALLLMSRVEGTPNVILEAQACGIPVAACDVGGVREALHLDGPGAGLLLDADVSPEDAAEQIKSWLPQALAAPPDDRINYVNSRYSMPRIASRVEAFYCGFPGVAP